MLWDLFGKICARVGKKLFHFGYNLLSKLADRIIPLDDSEKKQREEPNPVHNQQNTWKESIRVEPEEGPKKGKTKSKDNGKNREDIER